MLVIIAGSLPLLRTIKSLLQLSAPFMCSGDAQELVKVSVRGKKQVFRLTQRIPALNGGADTKVSKMLLSTNFEEHWTLPTFSDGQTVIQSVWSQKDLHDRSLLKIYGLPAIWIHGSGTPI